MTMPFGLYPQDHHADDYFNPPDTTATNATPNPVSAETPTPEHANQYTSPIPPDGRRSYGFAYVTLYKAIVTLLALAVVIAGAVMANRFHTVAYLFAGILLGAFLAFLLPAFIKKFENIAVIARNSDRIVAYLQAMYEREQTLTARPAATMQPSPIVRTRPEPTPATAAAAPTTEAVAEQSLSPKPRLRQLRRQPPNPHQLPNRRRRHSEQLRLSCRHCLRAPAQPTSDAHAARA